MTRRTPAAIMLAGVGLTVAPALSDHRPELMWNASASVPVGLYRVSLATQIEIADLVVVIPPDGLADFLSERGYLPRNVPLIKRVLALSGTTVCRNDATIIAYDNAFGVALDHDRIGRGLPVWQGCRSLRDGEVFLMNWDAPDSLDGRYFGPLPITTIVARVTPLWTDEAGDGRFVWRATEPAPMR
ncbi:S26 family signal peptidase [Aureimonas altamirensis]|uniref:S26 family signal peptidase n=1 Tax=Aureimonas altamirensis TaxID=370622 RepID=UPI001E48D7BD|nr:S26 family signal peptidase [Aureimonas altamirensis]UHD46344.1 S26 family signal peptidase [Aureimonas altamirensis]